MRRIALILIAFACRNVAAEEPSWAEAQSIPTWAADVIQRPEFTKEYALSARLNPFLLSGDFNGDCRLDVAILISRRDSGAQGIVVVHSESPRPVVLGAGHSIGNGGDDFSWLDAWSVCLRDSAGPETDDPASSRRSGDALLVQKLEAASAILFWDGVCYRWEQSGD